MEYRIIITKGHGNGGQHRNKVESCATVIHIKTGLKETCQETRSKIKNIELAKQRLIKRIDQLNKESNNEQRNEVTDHRTGKKAPYNLV